MLIIILFFFLCVNIYANNAYNRLPNAIDENIMHKALSEKKPISFSELKQQVAEQKKPDEKPPSGIPPMAKIPIALERKKIDFRTGKYRKLFLQSGFNQATGSATAQETIIGRIDSSGDPLPNKTQDIFELNNLQYGDIYEVGLGSGAIDNNGFGWEYEISFMHLRNATYDMNSLTEYEYALDKSVLNLGIVNFFVNGLYEFYHANSFELYTGLGIGAMYAGSSSENMMSNFAVPAFKFFFGTSINTTKTGKINVVYKITGANLSLYNKEAFPIDGVSENTTRGIDDSFLQYRYLIHTIGIEIVNF